LTRLPLEQGADTGLDFLDDLAFSGHLAALHQDLSGTDGGVHAVAVGGVDQVGNQVMVRDELRVVQIQQQTVREHARGDASGLQTEDPGSAGRGAGPGLRRGHDRGVSGHGFAAQGRELHLLKHVQIVVGGAPVRAEADAHDMDTSRQGFKSRVRQNAQTRVSDIMLKLRGTIDADAGFLDALKVIYRNKVTVLPVFEGDKLVGVLRDSDLFLAAATVLME